MAFDIRTDLMEMDERMFAKKQQVDSLNQEIADFFMPERANFTSHISWGRNFADHLTDFYPVLVRRELGDQIGGMTRPANKQWFKATVGEKDVMRDPAASQYLEAMTDINRAMLYSRDAGFLSAAKGADQDFACFGMPVLHAAYTKDRSNIMWRNHHPRDVAIEEGPDGNVDHLHRKVDMTPRSMQYWFKKVPPAVESALTSDPDAPLKCRHVFIPLDKYEPKRKFPRWAKWADIYLGPSGEILQERPSPTFDYVCPRWQRVSGHLYAFSPATIIALPQARMIQRMMMTLIEAGEKQVDPPMVATEDVINGPIDLSAGGVTYIDAEYDEKLGLGLRPLDLGKNVQLGGQLLEDSRRLLADAFYLNKLTLPQDRQKTAYETSQLVAEYIRAALPLFEPIENEYTGAVLELQTAKTMWAGGYGPIDPEGIPVDMPDSLLGQTIEYEFNNALTEARNRETINGYIESGQLLAQASQIDPAMVGEVDTRTAFRDAFAVVPGTRADWLNGDLESGVARSGIERMQLEQAALTQAGQMAEVAGEAGKAAQEIEAAIEGLPVQ